MELMDVLDMAGRVAVFGAICSAVIGVVWKLAARAHCDLPRKSSQLNRTSATIPPITAAPPLGLPPEALHDPVVAMQYGIGNPRAVIDGRLPLSD